MRWLILCLVLSASIGVPVAHGAQPRTMSYQGSLMDGNGLTVPDGNYALTFRLWDAAAGGSQLWQEVDTVAVAGSLFNVLLGKNTTLSLDFDAPYWLGISVGANPELAPRVEMASSPYARHAERAAVADSLNGGLPGELSCSVITPATAIPNNQPIGARTGIPFLQEEWDRGGFHDNVTNPSRLTAPMTGTYSVVGAGDWAVSGVGTRAIALKLNGSWGPPGPFTLAQTWGPAIGGGGLSQNVTMIVRLNAGDYVELNGWQNSGGSLSMDWARFAIVFLGK